MAVCVPWGDGWCLSGVADCCRRMNPCFSWEHVLDISFACCPCLFRSQQALILAIGGVWGGVCGTLVMGFSKWRCRCVFEMVQGTSHPKQQSNASFFGTLQRNGVCSEKQTVQRLRDWWHPFGKRTIKIIAQSKKFLSALLLILGLVFCMEI